MITIPSTDFRWSGNTGVLIEASESAERIDKIWRDTAPLNIWFIVKSANSGVAVAFKFKPGKYTGNCTFLYRDENSKHFVEIDFTKLEKHLY